jgi:transposase-like protein
MPILSGIHTLGQHLEHLQSHSEDYLPDQCPSCGRAGLWRHGYYTRKSDREGQGLNPIPIPRFRCPHCRRTCSSLPQCIPPRRWYLWTVQELLIRLVLLGYSFNSVCHQWPPSRATLRRWWRRLQERFPRHRDALCARWPWAATAQGFRSFWRHCLSRQPLSEAMLMLLRVGVRMP